MNRRQFMKYSAWGLAAVGGFSMANSLMQLQTVSRERFSENAKRERKEYTDLLYLASLAPSGHNAQPWTVKMITDHHWIIGSSEARWLPAVDPDNRELLISIGAFLENLVVAAKSQGYEANVHILAQQPKAEELVDVQLYKRDVSEAVAVKPMKLRRTVRNHFLTDEISREDIKFLTGENKEHFIYYPRKSQEGSYLAEGTVWANKLQADNHEKQAELAQWIRWSNQDIKQYGNGLTPETMEIEGLARWYVKNFYSRQSVLTDSFREATIKNIREQVATGGGWLVITSNGASVPELIGVGRKLQNIWLKIRDKKIAIHPMTQMLEEIVTKNEISAALGIRENIQMLLRIGYIHTYPEPVSPRMPLKKILL
ncbi:hypothetical protein P22_0778 [Propionispora sp. 2/2-37]|uniref:Acg family FMN-binding oxidoreductase n=1 Tax=Propionispora sp. 2/2-37 TaxID=1677858 RepID=UPI0006BB733C|nr:nitroreductase [Propionispora sp. 2/2-37]CUH94712.1 hypothetical protein P22_0778 [Propionispora sp. 2/2-37]